MLQYLDAYFAQHNLPDTLLQDVAAMTMDTPQRDMDAVRQELERVYQMQTMNSDMNANVGANANRSDAMANAKTTDTNNVIKESTNNVITEAIRISLLLQQNTQEMNSIVRALNGEYILPEAGGDLLRDGAGVLPTGRNVYALDPYRMPSAAAMARGEALAYAIIEQHR